MPTASPLAIRLTHLDPALNRARFYEASIQPPLFGEVAVMRNWGRIGTQGRGMMVTLPDEAQALLALRSLERQKHRRGYRSRIQIEGTPP